MRDSLTYCINGLTLNLGSTTDRSYSTVHSDTHLNSTARTEGRTCLYMYMITFVAIHACMCSAKITLTFCSHTMDKYTCTCLHVHGIARFSCLVVMQFTMGTSRRGQSPARQTKERDPCPDPLKAGRPPN